MNTHTLTVGSLAYVDALFSGLVPCKVIEVRGPGELSVRVTARRGAYRRGEVLDFSGNDRIPRVLPRSLVHVRGGQFRISAGEVVAR